MHKFFSIRGQCTRVAHQTSYNRHSSKAFKLVLAACYIFSTTNSKSGVKMPYHGFCHYKVRCLILYKWKYHFYEMKGDVGMSRHEKKGNKKMHTLRQKV